MPISEPSYFPPQRAGDQIIGLNAGVNHTGARVFLAGQAAGNNSSISDIIFIGDETGPTGWTDVNAQGSILIGSSACTSLVANVGQISGANTIIGYNAAADMLNGGGNVMIGANACALTSGGPGIPCDNNVVIGNNTARYIATGTSQRIDESVIIGANACLGNSMGNNHNITTSVIIGAEAAQNISTDSNCTECIVIGDGAGQFALGSEAAANALIVIGCGSDGGGRATNSIFIGSAVTIAESSNGCTMVGNNSQSTGGTNSTGIGDNVHLAGDYNVVIGAAAGRDNGNFFNTLLIEVGSQLNPAPLQRLVKGDFSAGNMILGNSTPGNLSLPASTTNALMLVNGSNGITNPVGGGYFYVAAGALHWVGSSGTNTLVAPA